MYMGICLEGDEAASEDTRADSKASQSYNILHLWQFCLNMCFCWFNHRAVIYSRQLQDAFPTSINQHSSFAEFIDTDIKASRDGRDAFIVKMKFTQKGRKLLQLG